MKTYLVGGAVRDALLGLPVVERDYVVVGASENEMIERGFRSVGRDFPVYLHPDTQEEYALARTERKTGPGHQGFECETGPGVTLEEDLRRRDLTINAIAQTAGGTLIDPWGGQADLNARRLRHVSEAFVEDPLRVLRVARFRARLFHLGFEVDPGTTTLLRQMVDEGQLSELTPERVFAEVQKALATDHPAAFFTYLDEIGALTQLFPEISRPDIARLAESTTRDPDARLAILLLHSPGSTIDDFCRRLKMPRDLLELLKLVSAHQETWRHIATLTAQQVVELLVSTDGIRNRQRFDRFNRCCEEIFHLGLATSWSSLLAAAAQVRAADVDQTLQGPALGEAIRAEQVNRVSAVLGATRPASAPGS